MQDVTPIIGEEKKIIETYGNGGFKISDERFESSVIILPEEVSEISHEDISEISDASVETIISNSDNIEILLVGAGKASDFFEPEIEKNIKSKGISIEYMDTGAACRTYNVLLSEERKVAALLIAV